MSTSENNSPNDTTQNVEVHTPSLDLTVKGYRVKILQRNKLIKRLIDLSSLNFDEMSLAELDVKLELLEKKYKQFDTLQSELEHIDESQIEEDHRDKFEDVYCTVKSKISNKMSLQRPLTNPLSSTQINQHELSSRPTVNLPKIKLPTFDGTQRQWIDFYNMFLVMVDKNDELCNTSKLQYLKSCLEGEAETLLQSLEVSENNYHEALQLLVSRYDNKRYIFNAHIQEIFRVKDIANPNVIQLRSFVDNINSNLRALQSFASKNQISDGIILHMLVSKLDAETASKWEEEIANNSKANNTNSVYLPSWDELSQFLERRCQTLNIIASNNTLSKPIIQPQRKQTTFLVSGYQSCKLCDQPNYHNPFKCTQFMKLDPIARYELVKHKGLCLNCLASNHVANNCPSNNRCQHCRVTHHTLLHREKPKPVVNTQERPNETDFGNNAPIALNVMRNNCDVILATALVELSTTSGKKMIARALLDSASQPNFITE